MRCFATGNRYLSLPKITGRGQSYGDVYYIAIDKSCYNAINIKFRLIEHIVKNYFVHTDS